MSSAYHWVIATDSATSGYTDKFYKTLDLAEKACAASATCKGINRAGKNFYILATGDGLRVETAVTTYIKGGKEANQQTFSWPAYGYTWHYSAPFALDRIYRTYNTLPEAFRGKTDGKLSDFCSKFTVIV